MSENLSFDIENLFLLETKFWMVINIKVFEIQSSKIVAVWNMFCLGEIAQMVERAPSNRKVLISDTGLEGFFSFIEKNNCIGNSSP